MPQINLILTLCAVHALCMLHARSMHKACTWQKSSIYMFLEWAQNMWFNEFYLVKIWWFLLLKSETIMDVWKYEANILGNIVSRKSWSVSLLSLRKWIIFISYFHLSWSQTKFALGPILRHDFSPYHPLTVSGNERHLTITTTGCSGISGNKYYIIAEARSQCRS